LLGEIGMRTPGFDPTTVGRRARVA
jgi:hypothetical protein